MLPKSQRTTVSEGRKGVGPLIPPLTESQRPLRQQVFELIRAAGQIPRVQLAKDLGISPASVTTMSSELIEAGLVEEVAAPRDNDAGRGRPAARPGEQCEERGRSRERTIPTKAAGHGGVDSCRSWTRAASGPVGREA